MIPPDLPAMLDTAYGTGKQFSSLYQLANSKRTPTSTARAWTWSPRVLRYPCDLLLRAWWR